MDVSNATPEESTEDLLTDDHELDEPRSAFDDEPVHLARCTECAIATKFRANVTGTSFVLVDADPDAVFGVGPNGRPICPNGHGEMLIADEALPAAEAFALAQEQIDAVDGPIQRDLPGVFPRFNFEACFMELEAKAVEVDRLHRDYKSAAEAARDAKKDWDSAAELYTKMALEFRRRRQAKEDGTDEGTVTVHPGDVGQVCTWAAQHPGETCPLCNPETVPFVIEAHLGDPAKLAPPDAVAHVEDVDRFLEKLEIDAARESLENVDTYISDEVIAGWTKADREIVTLWADAQLDKANNVPDVIVPARPKILGKPHIPATAIMGEHQVCSVCEVVIHAASDDEDPYETTAYVGTDCSGKPSTAEHRYPDKKKKAAAKKIVSQPKPSAAKKKAKGQK